MYEHHKESLLPRQQFLRRVARHGGVSALIILVSLGIGTAGYHAFGGMPWVDSLLNASMILTGMGPVSELSSTAAKLFASAYAIFSGLVFMSLMGIFLVPIAHRMLHRFHMDDTDTPAKTEQGQ